MSAIYINKCRLTGNEAELVRVDQPSHICSYAKIVTYGAMMERLAPWLVACFNASSNLLGRMLSRGASSSPPYRGTRRKSCGCRILIPVYKWHMKPFATKCRSGICIDFGSFYCAPGFPLRRAHLIIIRISSSPRIGSSHGDNRLQHVPVVRLSTRTLVQLAME